MLLTNEMEISFSALSVNEGFARVCVASFCVPLNPTLDEITDIKTAVSEAVTNSVVHAYPKKSNGLINIKVQIFDNKQLCVIVSDNGIGIENIEKAREPFFTTKPNEERSGMGFTVMESFMDKVDVENNGNSGVKVTMFKRIGIQKNKMALEN